jgi:peptidoglycan/LPS O-acetylase OafA/YrhL
MAATTKQDDPREPDYYRSLDGLRGLAALMVAYGHAGYAGFVPLVVGCATAGVILFFFLSGFLMAHHYLPSASLGVFTGRAVKYWLAFLLRRFVRVYPPYILAPAFGFLLLTPLMPPEFRQGGPPGDVSILEAMVRLATFGGTLGIYWTIQVELFFYLIYPLIAGLCLLSGRRSWTLLSLAAFLMFLNHFPHGLAGISWKVPLPGMWAGYISMFVAGAFTAAVAKDLPVSSRRWPIPSNALAPVSLAAFALAVGLLSRSRPTQAVMWQLEWMFAGLFFVMFLSLVWSNGPVSRLLSSRPAVAIGRASYSLYLVHIIAYHVVTRHLPAELHGMPAATLVLAALCSGYYFLFERPFVRLSKKIPVVEGAEQTVPTAVIKGQSGPRAG